MKRKQPQNIKRLVKALKPNCRIALAANVKHNGTAYVYPSNQKGTK